MQRKNSTLGNRRQNMLTSGTRSPTKKLLYTTGSGARAYIKGGHVVPSTEVKKALTSPQSKTKEATNLTKAIKKKDIQKPKFRFDLPKEKLVKKRVNQFELSREKHAQRREDREKEITNLTKAIKKKDIQKPKFRFDLPKEKLAKKRVNQFELSRERHAKKLADQAETITTSQNKAKVIAKLKAEKAKETVDLKNKGKGIGKVIKGASEHSIHKYVTPDFMGKHLNYLSSDDEDAGDIKNSAIKIAKNKVGGGALASTFIGLNRSGLSQMKKFIKDPETQKALREYKSVTFTIPYKHAEQQQRPINSYAITSGQGGIRENKGKEGLKSISFSAKTHKDKDETYKHPSSGKEYFKVNHFEGLSPAGKEVALNTKKTFS